MDNYNYSPPVNNEAKTKFCRYCGGIIHEDAVVCIHCGRQVERLYSQPVQQPIIINNTNTNMNSAGYYGRAKSKLLALIFCFFFGVFGVHKFYEGKIGMGILYIFTVGLFGIGVVVDFIVLLFKPDPYFV